MIIQFSSLLRHTLVASGKQTAPLGDEIEAVRHYLAIEKLRFEDRLETRIDTDSGTLGLNVPVFLVQPLVENAIKYGMQTTEHVLNVSISSRLEADVLVIEVANTGVWVEATHPSTGSAAVVKQRSTGIGLENLRKRLEQLYPNGHTMDIVNEQGMVRVQIRIHVQELSGR
jgi:LytS/YehU family sensor histidine kinase